MTPNADEKLEIVKKLVGLLMEHFDSVQVLATCHDDDGTHSFVHGDGNVYARVGLAREWLDKDQERTRLYVQRDDRDEIE